MLRDGSQKVNDEAPVIRPNPEFYAFASAASKSLMRLAKATGLRTGTPDVRRAWS